MLFLSPNSSQILPTQLQVLSGCLKPKPKQDHHIFSSYCPSSKQAVFLPHRKTPFFLLEVVNSENFQRDKIYLNTNIKHREISPGTPPDPHQKCPLLSASVCQLADISG